jgi:ferredoxin--NADP+ reductase
VHAVRHTIGLTHQADIQQFKQHFGAQFCYLPIVTREASTTLRGRIPQLLANGALIQAAQLPLTPEASQILLCGNPAMIKDSMAWFISQGFKKNSRSQPGQLTTESYWQ